MNRPKALILRAPGTNCDRELAHAFEISGANPSAIHLDALISNPDALKEADLIGFPGGFSYGDDIAAGRVFADRVSRYLRPALIDAISRNVPIIGICNGFQVLVKAGILPDPALDAQTVTLAHNTSGRFVDRWVGIQPVTHSRCIWTQGLTDNFELPIAHGEGRLTGSPDTIDTLEASGQVALRYTEDINGSERLIAGICDPSGLVLGLMPHPERWCDPLQHPRWSRLGPEALTHTPEGLTMIRNAVEHSIQPQTATAG